MLSLKSFQEVFVVQIDLLSLLIASLHVLSQKSNIETIKMGRNFVQTDHFLCHCWCTSAGTGRTDVTHRFHVSLTHNPFSLQYQTSVTVKTISISVVNLDPKAAKATCVLCIKRMLYMSFMPINCFCRKMS